MTDNERKEVELKPDDVIAFAVSIYESQGYPKNSFEMLDSKLSRRFILQAENLIKCGYAKFGKDNSGMVPRAGLLTEDKADQVARDIYDLIHLTVKPPSGKEFGAYIECRGIAKALIDKYGFSQQPPKERKVSLEEIKETIRQEFIKPEFKENTPWLDRSALAVLSLLNATEGR
jgi:hypothetical protein